MSKRVTRTYNNSFIREAINLVESGDRSLNAIADSLGIPNSTLRQWHQKYLKKADSYAGKDALSPQEVEIQQLRKDLADARLERDILKKAVAIFSKPQG